MVGIPLNLIKWIFLLGSLFVIGVSLKENHLQDLMNTIDNTPTVLVIVILLLIVAILLKSLFKTKPF